MSMIGKIAEYKVLMQLHQKIESELKMNTTDLIKKLKEMKVNALQIGTHTVSVYSKSISEKVWLAAWE